MAPGTHLGHPGRRRGGPGECLGSVWGVSGEEKKRRREEEKKRRREEEKKRRREEEKERGEGRETGGERERRGEERGEERRGEERRGEGRRGEGKRRTRRLWGSGELWGSEGTKRSTDFSKLYTKKKYKLPINRPSGPY